MMNKLFTIKKGIVIAITLATVLPCAVFAQTPPENLIIEFQSQPLFQELNFLPGDSVTRWVKVTNNTPGAEDIIVDAINVSDPDNLGSAFSILIQEGATAVYSGTLAELFSAGEVLLSNVSGDGGQAQYFFTAQFLGPSGDEFQEKTLGFDLLVGFSGGTIDGPGEQPITIVTTSIGGEGGGGGGGGGNGPPTSNGLTIYNETAITGSSPDTVGAVVAWDTNYNSTSRVIYGTVAGVFDYNSPPNYGYPFSTPEFDTPAITNGVTHHIVTLTGLTPDVTYYYRVVSTASPPTVGYERSFTPSRNGALAQGGDTQNNGGTNSSSIFVSGSSLGLGAGGVGGESEGTSDESGVISNSFGFNNEPSAGNGTSLSEEAGDTGLTGGNQLALASFGDIDGWWWFLLLILILLFVLWMMSRRGNQQ